MTQSLGMRATSFAASAVLLGIAVFGAFSITISLQTESGTPPFVIPMIPLAPPEPPPLTRQETPPPRVLAPENEAFVADPPETPPRFDDSGLVTISLPPLGPAEITNPRWLRRPQDLGAYYPRRALDRDIAGQVLLDCLVDTNGALNCSVVSETPANWGFGAAAMRIARDHRMVPAMRDGQAVQGRYRMRVPFEVR